MKAPDPAQRTPRIVSGGQTGVDRGALDAAIDLGLPHGGWCPRGRRAEDGPIEARYQLQETNSRHYGQRTEKNVVESDGTLILFIGELKGGTELTLRITKNHHQPCLCVDLTEPWNLDGIHQWIQNHQIETLNIAGPRESGIPGIRDLTYQIIRELFAD